MLNDFLIVSTAISSFNNASLYNPLFFAVGLLMLPLFFMVYLYGNDFVSRFGWNKNNIGDKVPFFVTVFLGLWLLIFGGNYAVIRDGISLLPLFVSIVMFVLTVLITQQSIKFQYIEKILKQNKKTKWLLFGILMILTVFSAKHTLVGILLQISAVLCGMIVGCRIKKEISLVPAMVCILGFVATLILMQPEYFRFGQLGNLTFIHLLSVLFVGFCSVTMLVTRYTNARSKIYASAYIKLKWLFRILSVLALVLFISTESVPVFIGLMVFVALLEMLTVYHSNKSFESVSQKSLSLLLICFGLITICPVITSLGIIYSLSKTEHIKLSDFTVLL